MAVRYANEIKQAAQRYRIPARVLAGLIEVESGFNPNATSSAGARGLTQFMPGTGRSYGVQYGSSPGAVRSQVFAAAKYLTDLGYQKRPRFALGAYNGGPGNPQYGYADKVLAASRNYGGLDRAAPAPTPTGAGAGGATVTASATSTQQVAPVESAGTGISDLLRQEFQAQKQQRVIPVSAPPLPSFAARPAMAGAVGGVSLPSVGAPVPAQSLNVDQALSDIQTAAAPATIPVSATATTGVTVPAGGAPAGRDAGAGWGGYHFPVGKGHAFTEERTDRGQDFSTNPGGSVNSFANARVVRATGNPFPGSGPLLQVLDGPLKGKIFGVGHARRTLVRDGQIVKAGQPIAVAGGVGGGGPGHIEIYLALDRSGRIDQSVGSDHYSWTGKLIHDAFHRINPHLVRRQPIRSG